MKTKMKLFIFSMLMIVGMGNVMGQMPNGDYDKSREIAFMSDTGWVQGRWNVMSDATAVNKSKWNYSFVNSIPGIGGDTVCMRLVDTSDTHEVVSVYKWKIWDSNSGLLDTTIYGDTVKYILKDVIKPFQIYLWLESDTNTAIWYMILSAKFANPTPSIISDTSENRTPIVLSSDSITLSLNDFHVTLGQTYVGSHGYAHNGTINWYCNDTLRYSGTDTTHTFYSSGIYHVEIENVFVPDTNITYIYYRWRISDTIQINIKNTTGMVDAYERKSELSLYPNPTTDYLYFSEETEYSVFSIAGKEIAKGFGKEINVTDFDSGVYILNTSLGNARFIVQ